MKKHDLSAARFITLVVLITGACVSVWIFRGEMIFFKMLHLAAFFVILSGDKASQKPVTKKDLLMLAGGLSLTIALLIWLQRTSNPEREASARRWLQLIREPQFLVTYWLLMMGLAFRRWRMSKPTQSPAADQC